ncbi:general stress protein [Paenibacillus pinistramenti]|uniref:general stress protein n=1 Tax=Paenibacillus pinistramenti TaxID=1768003 RepID=UPI0011094FDD|nr:general stress protein [Paenibacillus pinistramenti]
MTKLVAGLFANRQDVSLLIEDLKKQDVDSKDILIIVKDYNELNQIAEDAGWKAPESGNAGNTIFGVLRGLTEIMEGARGEASALGPAAETLAGADLWAASDSLAVPLIGIGVPEEDAQMYHKQVADGRFLVLVQCDEEKAVSIKDAMHEHDSLSS